MLVTKIDGKDVVGGRTAEFLMAPGTYTVTVDVRKDQTYNAGKVRWKEATADVKLEVLQGHTYIPHYELLGDRIRMFFTDMGLNFPQECLPLYRFVNAGGNPGSALYQTQRKCERTDQ
jgi:hypothetical protein